MNLVLFNFTALAGAPAWIGLKVCLKILEMVRICSSNYFNLERKAQSAMLRCDSSNQADTDDCTAEDLVGLLKFDVTSWDNFKFSRVR